MLADGSVAKCWTHQAQKGLSSNRASVHQAAKLASVLLRAAYRRVYDSRHLQADCQEPRSTPEPYGRGIRIRFDRIWIHIRSEYGFGFTG